jgi:hypothetical protein
MLLATLVGVCAAFAGAYTPRHRNDLPEYLAPDGKLLAPLVYRDAQDGFAGVSGEIWTIEAGGHFSIARFLNEKTSAPYWERDCTPDELKAFAKTLAANHLLALPEQFGRDVKVNPHVLTLTFRKMKSELILQAGESVAEVTKPPVDDRQAAAWRDFISIVRALQVLAKDLHTPVRKSCE